MPFPILRTPLVVLSEVISLLEPNEIVTVSFCSQKVRSLLKSHYQRGKPLEWRLYMIGRDFCGLVDIVTPHRFYRTPVLSVEYISEAGHESEHGLIQMNGYKRGVSSNSPVLYFKDRVMGTVMIVEYVTDLFNRDIYGLIINRNDIWAITWINIRQKKKLYGLEIVDNSFVLNWYGDEPLRYILRNNCASGYYKLREHVSDNFRFDGKLGPAIDLSIHSNGHWVTLDNLMNFDFIQIIVKESRISVSDLHAFLKHWRSGGSHRLALLKLEFKTDRNFENFEEELKLVGKAIVVHNDISDEEMTRFLDGYTIQRNDGVKATIHFDIRYFVMYVWHDAPQCSLKIVWEVTVSFCSKKVRCLLKSHHQRREPLEWNLYMLYYDCCGRVDIAHPRDRKRKPLLSAKHIAEAGHGSEHKLIQMNGYKRGFSSDLPVLYFEDRVMGSKMIVDYVTDLFNKDIHGLVMDRSGIWAIDWINSRQKKMLRGFELEKNDLCNLYGDEAFNRILRDKCVSDYYIFEDSASVNFRFDGKLGPGRQLSFYSNGHWVTVDNLMNFDFIRIEVKESRISVSDLHSFLKHWRSGGSHRLAYLSLRFGTDRNFEHFEQRLELVEKPNVVDDRFSEERMVRFLDGYTIQRNDGVKATIRFGTRHFILIVWQETVFQRVL
ncbi:unnamed protein product [Caenorhabditis nigoni]